MATSTVEDYLKRIYLEQQQTGDGLVPTGQIAQALRVTPGTATAMVKTLADSGLVRYEPYAGVRLSAAGEQLATHVLRRHRLVELFLVEVMGIDWSEVHEEAEVLEHAVSDRLIDRMDAMLGRPDTDPHGDPIPSPTGRIPEHPETWTLLECPHGLALRVVRVTDQRAEFLLLLDRHGLRPGRLLEVVSRDALADVVDVAPRAGEPIRLGHRAASRILVARHPAPENGS